MPYFFIFLFLFSTVSFAGNQPSQTKEQIITVDPQSGQVSDRNSDTTVSGVHRERAPQMPDIHLHVEGPTTNVFQNQTAENVNQANSSATATATQYVSVWVQQLVHNVQSIDFKEKSQQLSDYLENNKWKIGFSLLAVSYISLSIFLIRENFFLNRLDVWSAWKHELTNEELLKIPQIQLAETMLKSIQAQYLNHQNPTDFVLPLVRFVQALETEEKRLNNYLCITRWLKHLKIFMFFPTSNLMIKKAKKRLDRLRILNHIFLSWAAEYNVMVALKGTEKKKIRKHLSRQRMLLRRHPQLMMLHT